MQWSQRRSQWQYSIVQCGIVWDDVVKPSVVQHSTVYRSVVQCTSCIIVLMTKKFTYGVFGYILSCFYEAFSKIKFPLHIQTSVPGYSSSNIIVHGSKSKFLRERAFFMFHKMIFCLWFVCLCQQRVWLWGSDSEPLERLHLLHLKAPGKTIIEAKPIKKTILLFISVSPQLYRPSIL